METVSKQEAEGLDFSVLSDLIATIRTRRADPDQGSYTASLFARGIPRMAQKVGEEGVETALAAATGSPTLPEEAADLLYHLLVLLEGCGTDLGAVFRVLREREGKRRAA